MRVEVSAPGSVFQNDNSRNMEKTKKGGKEARQRRNQRNIANFTRRKEEEKLNALKIIDDPSLKPEPDSTEANKKALSARNQQQLRMVMDQRTSRIIDSTISESQIGPRPSLSSPVRREYVEKEEPEPKPKIPKLDFQVMKANYYQELVDLQRNEDYERKTMEGELQDVIDKHKLERKELGRKQKKELEEFNGEDHESLQTFKDKQKEEMDQKEIDFEEERREIITRNQPRRNAISDILSRRETIEENLLKVLQQQKNNQNQKKSQSVDTEK